MRKGMSVGSSPGAHCIAPRRRNKTRTLAMVVAAAVLGTAAASTPILSEAATVPVVTITSPVAEGLFTSNPAAFTGTASSVTIKAVKWSLQNQGTGAWVQLGGASWGSARAWLPTLAQPVAGQATWSTSVTLGSGQFELYAKAEDTTLAWSAISSVVFASGPAPTAAAPGYLTIMFGRSNWVGRSQVRCSPGRANPAAGRASDGLNGVDGDGRRRHRHDRYHHRGLRNLQPQQSVPDVERPRGAADVGLEFRERFRDLQAEDDHDQLCEPGRWLCGSLTDP